MERTLLDRFAEALWLGFSNPIIPRRKDWTKKPEIKEYWTEVATDVLTEMGKQNISIVRAAPPEDIEKSKNVKREG